MRSRWLERSTAMNVGRLWVYGVSMLLLATGMATVPWKAKSLAPGMSTVASKDPTVLYDEAFDLAYRNALVLDNPADKKAFAKRWRRPFAGRLKRESDAEHHITNLMSALGPWN